MYDPGSQLAMTGTGITIGGATFSIPAVAAFGALLVVMGLALSLTRRRTRRSR